MLTLGSRVRYGGDDCIVVGRTIEMHSRYDLLFSASGRIEQNVPEKDLEPCSSDHGVRLAEEQRVRLGWGDCAENPASRVSGYKSGGVEHAARRFRGLPENICISAISSPVRSESDSLLARYSDPSSGMRPLSGGFP